ncbi:MAG: energy-coupling factor transporter transmembrane protein EcfT [Clostridia bacterium]|nr:energy-coupling factor transporter transmembrane protein EcfT [Clostridia bacterium]
MLKDITFGQYFDSKSVIHKADPRIKILLLILIIVFIFLAKNFWGLGLAALFILITMLVSKIPVKMYFKNLKAILPILIFTSIINVFYGEGDALFSIWKFEVTVGGLERAGFMALRIMLLIIASSTLTYATTPNDLTDGIESLLSPLRFIGLKTAVHTLAMMMTIALRFIPTLVEEAEKIMNAQKARGADLESGNLKEKVKALIPILIPLLFSAVRRAAELADAMECRCYNSGEGKTRMKQLKLHFRVFSITAITLIFGAWVILFNIFM